MVMLRWNIIINMFRCGTSVEDIIAMVDVEMEYYYNMFRCGTSVEDIIINMLRCGTSVEDIIINMFRCGTSVEDIIAMVDVEMEDLDRTEKELEGLTEGYELLNFSL